MLTLFKIKPFTNSKTLYVVILPCYVHRLCLLFRNRMLVLGVRYTYICPRGSSISRHVRSIIRNYCFMAFSLSFTLDLGGMLAELSGTVGCRKRDDVNLYDISFSIITLLIFNNSDKEYISYCL